MSCRLHARPGRSTCQRCGQPLCDWCEKLAPSWAAGICNDCLPFLPPGGTRRSSGLAIVAAALALGFALLSFWGLRAELARRPVDQGGVIWSASFGAVALLTMVLVLGFEWRRRKRLE